jgi:hypothetical protein
MDLQENVMTVQATSQKANAGSIAVGLCDMLWGLLFAVVGLIFIAQQVSLNVGLALLLPGLAGLVVGVAVLRGARPWAYMLESVVMLALGGMILLMNIEAEMFGFDQVRERLWDAVAVLLSLLLAGLSFYEYIRRSTRPAARPEPIPSARRLSGARGQVSIKCPHCPRSFSAPAEGNTCPHCGLRIDS